MRRFLVGLAVLLVAGLVSAAVFAMTAAEAPEATSIDDCVNKRAAVEFPHKAHFEVTDCGTCHHTQEDLTAGSEVEVETCASCHTYPESEDVPGCLEISTKTNPYHISCINCHKEKNAGDPAAALPVKCDDCHPKESA